MRGPARAILFPPAERDPAIPLGIFAPLFRGVRAVMYNSHEERAMIQRLVTNAAANGKFEAMVYSFPSDLCTDRGRAINSRLDSALVEEKSYAALAA